MNPPQYLAVLLGLSSGLCWGMADFFGGLQSRRLPAPTVGFWSHLAGGAALFLVIAARGDPPPGPALLWGIAAGIIGAVGLTFFYRGLAEGAMSIVAPISACGGVVPVLAALVLGEPPSPLAGAGIAAAFLGIFLVSRPSEGTPHPSGQPGRVIALSLGAALGFGFFFLLIDRATAAGVTPLWATGGARIGSIPTLLALNLAGRQRPPWPGRHLPALAAVGIADTSANLLFAIAATLGNLGVVAVLGSLYPVVPVLLARFFLAERLARLQAAGVVLALAGVALMSAG